MSENKSETMLSGNEEQFAVDLYCVISDVLKQWFSVLLLSIAAGLFAYVALTRFNPPSYATSATLVVTNYNEDTGSSSSSGSDVYENLNYGADSASRMKNILESKELKETVAKELGFKKFQGKTSAKTLGESNLLEITVRAHSPYISYKEAVSILNSYTRFSGDLVGGIEVTVLERPKVQEKPEHPMENVRNSILIGAAVMVALFAVLALMSALRDTVHNSSEVEAKIDAKLLATILHEKKYQRGKKKIGGEKSSILITDPVTSFQYAEDMRKLATRILNEMTGKNQKVLLVSSAMENEGKSTVAANIALAMSQINSSVILVDMDFRKPSVFKILNMQEADFADLSTLFENTENQDSSEFGERVASLICKVPGTELSVVLNRKASPQAVEKNTETIQRIVDELKKMADFVIIDTAPISLVSDAEELAGMADTSIIVVRQHWVEAKEINDTIDALGGKKSVLGCVFNNVRMSGKSGTAFGYGYGYGYGYGSGNGGHYAG